MTLFAPFLPGKPQHFASLIFCTSALPQHQPGISTCCIQVDAKLECRANRQSSDMQARSRSRAPTGIAIAKWHAAQNTTSRQTNASMFRTLGDPAHAMQKANSVPSANNLLPSLQVLPEHHEHVTWAAWRLSGTLKSGTQEELLQSAVPLG